MTLIILQNHSVMGAGYTVTVIANQAPPLQRGPGVLWPTGPSRLWGKNEGRGALVFLPRET
jgi:hypothetical protein